MSDPIWYPSGYCTRYGWQWCTAPYDGPPHYPNVPTIEVADAFALTLRFRPRRFWRKARDAALAAWLPAGLHLPVTEVPMGYEAGKITLDCVDIPNVELGGWAAFGMVPVSEAPLPGVGWVQVERPEFDRLWAARDNGSLKGIIAHEVGHTLGFGHGGTGVMAVPRVSNVVNAEEIAALRAYFKL